jgi:hypothetical protein
MLNSNQIFELSEFQLQETFSSFIPIITITFNSATYKLGPYPGNCNIKLFTAVINSVTKKASVFVKVIKKWLIVTKALAYYTKEFITAVKSFMTQAPGNIL